MRVEDLPKGTLIIEYAHNWGGSFSDKKFWCGRIGTEVYDYNTKKQLIKDAKRKGMNWAVLRYHKGGKVSVVEYSLNLNKESQDGS